MHEKWMGWEVFQHLTFYKNSVKPKSLEKLWLNAAGNEHMIRTT